MFSNSVNISFKISYNLNKFNSVVNEYLPSSSIKNSLTSQSFKTIINVSKLNPDLPFTSDDMMNYELDYEIVNTHSYINSNY